MFTGQFKFNITDAMDKRLQLHHPEYYGTYHTTNEVIEDQLPLAPIKNPRVLTVAASGDQPLMYASTGASEIDTFDISVFACMVMDFKTSALQFMTYPEYMQSVQNLYHLDKLELTHKIIQTINNMPQRTRTLMYNARMYRPDALSQHPTKTPAFPTISQRYSQIKSSVKTPFNFIWADLENVSHYIHGQYDIINISNIFDHYLRCKESPADAICDTIINLWTHLRLGGYIVCTSNCAETVNTIEQVPNWLQCSEYMKVSSHGNSGLFTQLTIQRKR